MKSINWSNLYRAVVWLVVGIAMVTIWSDIPDADETPGSGTQFFSRLMDAASSDNDANNKRAEGAPQQQVVNGWHSNDLLGIQVMQNNAILEAAEHQNRGIRSLTTLILALGLGAAADLLGTSLLRVRQVPTILPPERAAATVEPPTETAPLMPPIAPLPPQHTHGPVHGQG